MTEKQTTLVIRGKVGYEDEISPAQAAQIIAFLNAENDEAVLTQGPLLRDARDTNGASTRVESARDALDASGAKTNPEKIVALGAYVLQDGGETFKVEDVKAQFRRARETAPANFSRDLSAAVQAGWLAEDEGGEYYITNKIQGIFDTGFAFPKPGNGVKARGASRKSTKPSKGRSAKTGGKPDVFSDIDEFPSTMDGAQPYSRMKQGRDRLLWVVKFAKDRGIRGLANKDIVWLTDHLGEGIPTKQVTSVFNNAKKYGYANRSTQDNTICITEDGEAYLRTVGES